MKITKRAISILLALMLFSGSLVALAERASTHIASYGISTTALGSGVIRVKADIDGTHPRMTKIGFPAITLYEWSGSAWVPVKSEIAKYNPNATAGSHTHTFTYQGVAGRHYYSAASFYAQDTSGSDSRNANSPSVQAT